MSVTVTQIREGIAANLSGISAQILPYLLSNPSPPSVQIVPAEIAYDQSMSRGLDKYRFTVQVIVCAVSDIEGQKKLDTYLAPAGTGSVKTALESDRTLGSIVHNLRVTGCTGYRIYADDRGANLGAEWSVEVWATGL